MGAKTAQIDYAEGSTDDEEKSEKKDEVSLNLLQRLQQAAGACGLAELSRRAVAGSSFPLDGGLKR